MKTAIALTALCVSAALLSGCSSEGADTSYGAIAGNPTPDLRGLSERPIDADRHMVYAQDTQWRTFWEDLGRAWYTDHPSRLTPMPVAYTSGMPR